MQFSALEALQYATKCAVFKKSSGHMIARLVEYSMFCWQYNRVQAYMFIA
jgi:hypothetical protein